MSAPLRLALSALALLLVLQSCARRDGTPRPDCDIHSGACVRPIAGSSTVVAFDLMPKPVRAMAELRASVAVTREGAPVVGAGVALDLSMPGMVMAPSRTALRDAGNGVYEGAVVVVRCPSGQRVWKARIDIEDASGGRESVSFLIEARDR